MIEDVPVLLKSDDIKSVQDILTVLFTSLPTNIGEFVKWVAEVRRQEEGGSKLSEEEKARLAVKVFSSSYLISPLFTFWVLVFCLLVHQKYSGPHGFEPGTLTCKGICLANALHAGSALQSIWMYQVVSDLNELVGRTNGHLLGYASGLAQFQN